MDTPTVFTPTLSVRQPDGSVLFRAGKPQVVEPELGTIAAGKLLGLSPRRILEMCYQGDFPGANQPGGPNGRWRIPRAEVMKRKEPPAY